MELKRDSHLRNLLLEGKFEEFNRLAQEDPPDLESVDLRGVDLRSADLQHANLRGAYLRNTDLRGVDLLYADLDGASIHAAKIGGVRFPRHIPADEILLSLREGTRLRAQRGPAAPVPASPKASEETEPSS
jgi:uncharacterized protein YjbI with pentapeptide repeats